MCGEHGHQTECFVSSSSNEGGARRGIKDPDTHLTLGIAVSACRNITLLYLIASGENVMKSCWVPLDPTAFTDETGITHWLCNKNWFPSDAGVFMTKHGSIPKEVIIKVVKHINQHARKTVPASDHILLLLDGNSSRQGGAWLHERQKLPILVVKPLANTTHLIQPCDQFVNKCFQRTVRSTRDMLWAMINLSWANKTFKITLAVARHSALTSDIARKSFVDADFWLLNFQYLD